MGLFLDLLHVPVGVTNDAIEGIYKALSDGHNHGDDGAIWQPHQSVLIRRLVELFTQRGLDRLAAVKQALTDWQTGKNHTPSTTPVVVPPGAVQRWNADELALAGVYLESLPPAQWTLDDHMMAVDLVMHTLMSPDDLIAEAEWLAVRAGMMGKVQANMAAEPSVKQADAILAALPSSVAGAVQQFRLPPKQAAVLSFASARAAEHVTSLADGARHKMRAMIAEDLEQRALGVPPTGSSSLQTKMLDAFGTLNRDWRRIAVTEAGEAQLQGLVASMKPGAKLKRVEQYKGACAFCRKIDGLVVTVVAADAPKKNPDTEIWPGKNNIGRSASPRKRVGDVLVEREPHEMWQVPAGLVHPHCRGRWLHVDDGAQAGDDPEFAAWLGATLS
jgi:hypothetical protein